jgi:hypothetical protein
MNGLTFSGKVARSGRAILLAPAILAALALPAWPQSAADPPGPARSARDDSPTQGTGGEPTAQTKNLADLDQLMSVVENVAAGPGDLYQVGALRRSVAVQLMWQQNPEQR